MRGLRFGLVSSIHGIGIKRFLKRKKSSCVKNRSGVLNRFCMAGPLEGRQGQARCQWPVASRRLKFQPEESDCRCKLRVDNTAPSLSLQWPCDGRQTRLAGARGPAWRLLLECRVTEHVQNICIRWTTERKMESAGGQVWPGKHVLMLHIGQ